MYQNVLMLKSSCNVFRITVGFRMALFVFHKLNRIYLVIRLQAVNIFSQSKRVICLNMIFPGDFSVIT